MSTPRLVTSLHTGDPGRDLTESEASYVGYERVSWPLDVAEAVERGEIRVREAREFAPVYGRSVVYLVHGVEWMGRYAPLVSERLSYSADSGCTVHAMPHISFPDNILSSIFHVLGIDAQRIAAETSATP